MAHRGWSSVAPENTLAAIELAANTPGIQVVEVDVQLTRDHIPVVIHDYTVNRTTNGRGLVRLYTYDQLRKLDAGSWFSPAFKGERVPTLEQVLRSIKGKCRLNIDCKTFGYNYSSYQEIILDLVMKYRLQGDVMFTSFSHSFIRTFEFRQNTIWNQASGIKKGLNFVGRSINLPRALYSTGSQVASMQYCFLNQPLVDWLNRNEFTIVAWTVNDKDHIEYIKNCFPSVYICTDYPQYVVNGLECRL